MKTLFLTAIAFLFVGTASAQGDVKITTGVIAHNNGDYAKAIQALQLGLKDEALLKEKNIAKGWYYLGRSLMGMVGQAQQAEDMELLKKYESGVLDAYQCYKHAIEKDIEPMKYEKLASNELVYIHNVLLNVGLQELNTQAYNIALPYFDAAAYISENIINRKNYIIYDLRAQTHMGLTDSVRAQLDFAEAIESFKQSPPDRPDQLIGYAYYRSALLARYKDHDLKQALRFVQEGQDMVAKEHSRLNSNDHSPEDWSKLLQQYQDAQADLSSFELDILLNTPDMLQEALAKFDQAISDDPTNYIKHVAYAQLLERTDADRAIAVYQKAIAIDASQHIAHFNLGALYVNRAVEASKKSNESLDTDEADKYLEEINVNFKQALPHLENAFDINPTDLSTIRALKQVTIYLGLNEKYNKYKEAEQAALNR